MPRSRSLLPREHGAYAQLGAPLIAALAMRVPTAAAICLALAATCAFLANEPLLVVLGHRGRRARAVNGPRARRLLAALGFAAAGLGIAGLVLADATTRLFALGAAGPCAALLVLAWRRGQHSLGGEVVAAIALPALAAPVAVASGVAAADALVVWLAWAAGYAAAVVAVHRVIARHRAPRATLDVVLALALAVTVVAAVALAVSVRLVLVALPLVVTAALVIARPPRANRLRAIGVVLVAASVLSIAVALATT
jgi:hypothetical protein